ncbi:MAG: ECF-type sigma factor [Planctomycetaceae bacterium]
MSGSASVPETSVDLAEAYVSSDDSRAADRLYHRHRDATLKLAASGMSNQLQVRVDPEDVYQSVSLILLRGLKKRQFRLVRAGDLRALLAKLTHRRIQKKVEQNTAEKRSFYRETTLSSGNQPYVAGRLEHVTCTEQYDATLLLSRLQDPLHRKIVRMIMDGIPVAEVAASCDCSMARIRQVLRQISRSRIAATHHES